MPWDAYCSCHVGSYNRSEISLWIYRFYIYNGLFLFTTDVNFAPGELADGIAALIEH